MKEKEKRGCEKERKKERKKERRKKFGTMKERKN